MAEISIVLIDDDPATLESLKGYLEDVQQYAVSDHTEITPALQDLRNRPYDMLIMDWTVKPGGEEILNKVQEIAPDLPIIVLTGNAEAGAEAYGKGAYAYFQKPVRLERLVQAIQGAARKARGPEEKSLELVNAIGALLVEQQTLDAFANAIISKANSLVGSRAGCFYLWNWKENNFQKLASAGFTNAPQKISPAKSTRILEALSGETSLLVNTDDDAFQTFGNTESGFRSVILLHRGDLTLGLLVLDKPITAFTDAFTDQDRKTLRVLKTLVDPVLERMKVRDLLNKIEGTYYTTKEDLGEAVVNGLFELFGQPNALWLIDGGYTEFKIQSAYGLPDSYKNNIHITYDDKNSLLARAIEIHKVGQWEVIKVEKIQLAELIDLDDLRIQSLRAIPLFTSERAPLGAIVLYGTQQNAFKEYDLQLAQNFADQASRVLENLHRQSQSRRLAELSETLAARGHDEKSIFETFARNVLELTGAYNVAIYPYDLKRKYWFDTRIIIHGQSLEEKKLSEKPRETGLAFIVRHTGKILVEDIEDGSVSIQPIKNLDKIPDRRKITMAFLNEIVTGEKFIQREKIRAFAGISLRAPQMQAEVGIMYVNFQTPHRFTELEISTLEIAARQVASVVHGYRLSIRQQVISKALEEVINIIGITDPEYQLATILEKTASLFSADYGTINRLTEDGRHLQRQSRLFGDNIEIEKEDKLHPIGLGIIGHVLQTGEVFRTGDVSKVAFYDAYFPDTRSEMAIPLKNAFGGVIGVLNLESIHISFFSEEDQVLCESFARAASAAIQQSELFESIKSLHGLTESLPLRDFLDRVLKNLNKMMGTNTASSISLYDQENDNFYAFYGVGPDQDFTENYLMLSPRQNGTGRHVVKMKKSLYYDDVRNIPGSLPTIRLESVKREIVSYAVLPLIYQNKILGTLFIHKIEEKIAFTNDARQILETYAAQAALAIHNAQNRLDIPPLKEILDATVSRNREEILDLIVEKAVGVVTADYSSLFMGESEDLIEQAIYIKPEEREYFLPRKDKIRSTQGNTNMAVYKSGKPYIVNDVSEREKQGLYNRTYQKAKSEIAVPLVFRGEVIGTLNAESQYLGAYSEFDKTTLRVFADIAATAIKIAQDREEIQKQNEEIRKQSQELMKRGDELHNMNYRLERRNASFEALTEIGQQLTANIQRSEEEILAIIHQQASRIIDTNNMYIALYEAEKDLVHFALAFLDGKPVDINNDSSWQPRSGGQGRTEWIIRHKTPVLSYTKADAQAWYQQPDSTNYIGQIFASWLGVPIMYGDEVMGVIATYHKTEEYKYAPDDMKVLALMGRQAAIALTNARLVRQLDKRIIELDTIRELGEDLSKSGLSF